MLPKTLVLLLSSRLLSTLVIYHRSYDNPARHSFYSSVIRREDYQICVKPVPVRAIRIMKLIDGIERK